MGFSSLHPGWGIGAPDSKTTFLHVSLDDEYDGIILVKHPALLAILGLIPEGVYWKLKKVLYGLRKGPNKWSEHRDAEM